MLEFSIASSGSFSQETCQVANDIICNFLDYERVIAMIYNK